MTTQLVSNSFHCSCFCNDFFTGKECLKVDIDMIQEIGKSTIDDSLDDLDLDCENENLNLLTTFEKLVEKIPKSLAEKSQNCQNLIRKFTESLSAGKFFDDFDDFFVNFEKIIFSKSKNLRRKTKLVTEVGKKLVDAAASEPGFGNEILNFFENQKYGLCYDVKKWLESLGELVEGLC